MVKEFLLEKKDKLIMKFRKKGSVDDINRLIEGINTAVLDNDFTKAEKAYADIGKIYKNLGGDIKQKVFEKCIEIHKRIESKDNQSIDKIKIEEVKEEKKPEEIEQNLISEEVKEENKPKNIEQSPIPEEKQEEKKPENLGESPGFGEKPEEIKQGFNFDIQKEEKMEYIKTGVPGFDDLIDKGIPKGSNILVSGSAGSGKTTFSSHVLMNLASQGKKCLYMSFEESEGRLKRHLRSYGHNPDKLEQEGTLMIKRYDPFLISRSVEALLAEARGELVIKIDKTKTLIPENFIPDVVVVDSLSAIAAAFAEKEEAYRIYIEQLFRSFEKMGVTSFLITECEEGSKKLSKTGVEEFLADGVIAFYNLKKGNSRIPATEVVKLRGTSHKKKLVPFSFIEGKGIEVYPLQDIM